MTPKEIFQRCVTFAPGARCLLAQRNWPMPGVEDAWRAEGATERDVAELFALSDHLGEGLAINTGFYPPLKVETVLEDDEFRVQRDELGGVHKLSKRVATLPLPIEFPVKSPTDWPPCRPRCQWDEARLAPDWIEKARRAADAGYALVVSLTGFYAFPRTFLGDTALCLAYYDYPDLVREMCETQCDLALRVADVVERAGLRIDKLSFWEDMAGRQGSLVGPAIFREFLGPYYRRVIERFRRLGTYHVEVDSDGNIGQLIPLFVELGVTCLFPFECQAGMDIVQVRRQYPQLVIHGGIDKRALTQDKAAIDRELDYKLPPLIESGGYLCAADHRLLLGTTFENLRHYMHRVAEMIGKK